MRLLKLLYSVTGFITANLFLVYMNSMFFRIKLLCLLRLKISWLYSKRMCPATWRKDQLQLHDALGKRILKGTIYFHIWIYLRLSRVQLRERSGTMKVVRHPSIGFMKNQNFKEFARTIYSLFSYTHN